MTGGSHSAVPRLRPPPTLTFRRTLLAGAQPVATGLVARTIAACMPGAASWVKVTSASTKPTAAMPSRYSVRDRAPAMHPT